MKHPDGRIEALLGALAHPRLATIDLSLARITGLLGALGNPQAKLPAVIHVAGTNGKGSLLAYLTAIMQAAGYRVHRYTSPHLVRFNERIMLAGKDIEDDYLLSLLERVSAHSETHPVTFFEATTAAAFLAFAEVSADVLLLETGLGGRLDATNVLPAPALTAITPVSMDHMEYLGDSIRSIAAEKAGILKRDVQCVTGPQREEANILIEHTANKLNAPLYRFNVEWKVSLKAENKKTNVFHYHSAVRDFIFPQPNLPGAHQIVNAATAIACIDCLEGFTVTQEHIIHGITHAVWPGRLQRIASGGLAQILPERGELWLDGGHNPAAGAILAQWVSQQHKPVHIICAMLSSKDTAGFLTPLAPHIQSLTAIAIEDEPLGQKPQSISIIAAAMGIKSDVKNNVKAAIESIVKYNENDFIILICGSLYLAGNILWQNNTDV